MISTDRNIKSDSSKPLASLSLDLDNQWSYMKTHGDPGWEKFPSYFDSFIPILLDELDKLELNITCFIVGQDASLNKNRKALEQIAERGHEVGNHSFHHDPWFHLYSYERIESEIVETENSIYEVTGQKPKGFRGPGFTRNKCLLEILEERDYIYDASSLPTYLGPLARLYYFWTSDLSREERRQRSDLYGDIRDGLMPVKPYVCQLPNGRHLLEIPVTTIPLLKIPFHMSYLLYISRYSEILMRFYLNIAIFFCKISRIEPSFLLHPLDFIGSDKVPELAFFPGMDLNKEKKVKIFRQVIKILSTHFKFVNMSTHAESILYRNNIKKKRGQFRTIKMIK